MMAMPFRLAASVDTQVRPRTSTSLHKEYTTISDGPLQITSTSRASRSPAANAGLEAVPRPASAPDSAPSSDRACRGADPLADEKAGPTDDLACVTRRFEPKPRSARCSQPRPISTSGRAAQRALHRPSPAQPRPQARRWAKLAVRQAIESREQDRRARCRGPTVTGCSTPSSRGQKHRLQNHNI